MRWRILSLTSLLGIAVILRDGGSFVVSRTLHPLLNTARLNRNDAESLLAQGRPLSLLCSSAQDLELLLGVTDRVASELLREAESLVRLAPVIGEEAAFERVHGIGPKRAAFFATHLSLNNSCSMLQKNID